MKTNNDCINPEILIEEWKVYKETYNDRWGHRVYEISNFGRVKLNGELVNFDNSKPGYYKVANFYVHRAVAKLFIPNPDNKPCVDHIDTNKHNNMVTNLKWVTHEENNNNPLTRKHMSEIRKERWSNPEYKQKMIDAQNKAETKKKRSEAHKGEKSGFFGKHHTEETKQKMRKPKPKYLWLTENGDQIWMAPSHVAMHHKDWKLISKNK